MTLGSSRRILFKIISLGAAGCVLLVAAGGLTGCSASDAKTSHANGSGTGGSGAAGAGGSAGPAGSGGSIAGAGGAGQPGSGGAGGTPMTGPTPQGTNPPVDPNIMFDWAETDPALTCLPGHYAGAFNGNYTFATAFYAGTYPIAGNITLVLVQSQNGEQLEISDGHITGKTNYTIPFTVDLNGTLDCTQSKLIDGKLVNGVYTYAGMMYHYEGDIAADYDKQAHQFVNGTWSVHEPMIPANHGSGAWQAGYTGP